MDDSPLGKYRFQDPINIGRFPKKITPMPTVTPEPLPPVPPTIITPHKGKIAMPAIPDPNSPKPTYNPETHFLQPRITGYKQLTPDQTEVINEAKRIGQLAGNLVESLTQDKSIDQRWLAIAKTDLQKGFMALVRSVAQPDSF